jgi:hypothetical protein
MGAWGTGIFADDEAADLRSEYRTFLADAQSDEGATDAAIATYDASFEQLSETTAFWLALALMQWRLGRLDPRVKEAALRIIDDGLDLAKWEGSPDKNQRAIALRKARKTIVAPPPPAKPMPKPLPVQLPGWEFSEVIGYRMPRDFSEAIGYRMPSKNKYVLLHMLNYRASLMLAVKAPVVAILNWFGEDVPTQHEVAALTYINHNGTRGGHHLWSLAMPRRKPLAPGQFEHLGWQKPVTTGEATSPVGDLSGHEGGTLAHALNKVLWLYWKDPTRPPHRPKMRHSDGS